jgi:hypothetical protein
MNKNGTNYYFSVDFTRDVGGMVGGLVVAVSAPSGETAEATAATSSGRSAATPSAPLASGHIDTALPSCFPGCTSV